MTITLDHTIIPSSENRSSAEFFARILGLELVSKGHFEAVRVNESLTLDFENQDDIRSEHYAFLVNEEDFDQILIRIMKEGVSYGSGPFSADDGEINHRRGGRGLYFTGGPDPHLWEVMTRQETGTL